MKIQTFLLYAKNWILMIITILMYVFCTSCTYQLSKNISTKKFRKNNQEKNIFLYSYDPFGLITKAIRSELYMRRINVSDDFNNYTNIKNMNFPYLHIINISERCVTTSVFQDGTIAGYQLVLYVYAKLLIPNDNSCYPINIQVHRTFLKNPKNFLINDVQNNDIHKLMYQEAAEKLISYILLQFKIFT